MEYGLVALWLVAYLALGVAALPLASAVAGRLPDRGAGLALPLAIAVLGLVGFWVGQVAFPWPALLAGLAALVGSSTLALRRGTVIAWRRFGEAAAVFAVAFGLLIAVRAGDPGAWPGGGEKFLDFGLLASLLRAEHLPPVDHWFAGERVRYYYGGHMIAALLATLTDTPPRFAYNLALAGVYGLFVSTAYGVAGAVAAGRDRSYAAGGLVGAFFVALASNLAPPIRLLGWLLPGGLGGGLVDLAGLDRAALFLGPRHFDYWVPSRVIPGTINEFPLFAFLNGDLHAHMSSQPLVLLTAGLGYAYYRTPRSATWHRRGLALVALPGLGGLLAVVNTWDAPVAVGLAWLALTFAPAPPWDLLPGRLARAVDRRTSAAAPLARPLVGLGLAVVVAALALLAALPFFLGPASPRSIMFLPDRSTLPGLLVVHGGFLGVAVAYLADRSRAGGTALVAVAGLAVVAAAVAWVWTATAVVVLGLPLAGGWYLLVRDRDVSYETVLLVGACGLALLVEFAFVNEQPPPSRYNTVFKVYAAVWSLFSVAAAPMLAALIDWPGVAAAVRRHLARPLGWVGTAGGSAAPGGTDGGSAAPDRFRDADGRRSREVDGPGARSDGGERDGGPRRHPLRVVLAVGLLVSLSVYAGFALHWHHETARAEPTLDARAYVAEHHPGEYAAIQWLDAREGQPTIASRPGESIYRWVNGPASLTGVPTVAGWAHERGYRGYEGYQARVRDVDRLFTGNATVRRATIERYGVDYVYVGPMERQAYGPVDFRGEPGLAVVFDRDAVTIYAVVDSPP